jgi:hypothetical protein
MSTSLHERLSKALAVIPVILITTIINVLMSSTLATIAFIQLVSVAQWDKYASLAIAVLIAIAVRVYIWLQPNIRNYIRVRSQ